VVVNDAVGAIFFILRRKRSKDGNDVDSFSRLQLHDNTTENRKYIDFAGNSDQPEGSPNLCDCLSVIEAQTLIFE
jgi:hypothetical protein